MKSITLDSVLALLKDPAAVEVTVPADIAARAKVAIDKMFELAD
jgi:quinolinate synthase